jgi:predicted phosphodiesterase
MVADLPDPSDPAASFGMDVDLALTGTSHVPLVAHAGGTIVVNPGSPTLPAATGPTVALLDLTGDRPAVHLVHLPRSHA